MRAHEIKVWDAVTGQNLATLTGQGILVSAAFSPDGRWLALGGQDGLLLLADWAESKKTARLQGHKGYVAAVAFSRDGQLLASAGVDDRMVKIWVLDGFDPASVLEPAKVHTVAAPPHLCDLAFTADNRRLAGISRDVVKMWDVGSRQEVLSLRGAPQRHWDPAFNPRVAFSNDGKRLAGTNWNESISMWDTGISGDEDALARHQLARQQAADARAVFWHLEEAEDCLEHHNLAAARFHFQRLGEAPLPGPLRSRQERLAKDLQK
jgi:WD40 repeat protein